MNAVLQASEQKRAMLSEEHEIIYEAIFWHDHRQEFSRIPLDATSVAQAIQEAMNMFTMGFTTVQLVRIESVKRDTVWLSDTVERKI